MDFRIGAGTNVGNVRDHNEDSFCVNRKASLYIVADGMGGHAAGEIASNQLKDFIEEYLLREDRPDSIVECLTQGVQAANRSIYQMGIDDPKKRGMGTTATILVSHGERYVIAHVGDSRCYLVRDGELFQITRDHSRVYQLYESGLISKEEMEDHPMSNVITRSIGNHATVDPDIYEGDIVAGDRFLLCSDGLTGEVREVEIAALLADIKAPQAAVDKLIQRALEEGGKDNVTCLVVDARAGDDERRKTVPLTLDQLKRMPPPKAVVEEVELDSRRSSGSAPPAAADTAPASPKPADPAPAPDAEPAPRGGGRPKRPGRQASGAAAGIAAAAGALALVALALWFTRSSDGGLHLTSTPKGAEVYVNNSYRDNTPCVIDDLPAGKYSIRLQHPDVGRVEREVEVIEGRLEPLTFTQADFKK